jgi:NADH-quinone oxidoreductase subunit C
VKFSRKEKNLIQTVAGRDLINIYESTGDLFVEIIPSSLIRIASMLYAHEDMRFNTLMDAFAVDNLSSEERFEISYQLYNMETKKQLFLVIKVEDQEPVLSLSIVFNNVIWYEREIFDMFGIIFANNPDLRRILNPSDYNEFPLRKNTTWD